MNKDQFIYWLKGFVDAAQVSPTQIQWGIIKEKLDEIKDCPDYGSPIDKTIINPFPKINPEPNPLTPFKSTPNPYIVIQSSKEIYGTTGTGTSNSNILKLLSQEKYFQKSYIYKKIKTLKKKILYNG